MESFPNIDKKKIKKILIIQPSRIGDVIFSLPTLNGLRRLFPNAHISWAIDERCREIITGHSALNSIIIVDFPKVEELFKSGKIFAALSLLKSMYVAIKKENFDLSIDLHGLGKSAFLALAARRSIRLGSPGTNGMHELSGVISQEVPLPSTGDHTIHRHLAIVEFLGGKPDPLDFGIYIPENARNRVKNLLKEAGFNSNERLVVVHPGAGWLSRRWPKDRFAQLIKMIYTEDLAKIVLVGGRVGGSEEETIFSFLREKVGDLLLDLSGRLSLKELGALMEEANLFIGNEAGPAHLAASLGREVLALVGPTIPGRTGPFGPTVTILRKDVGCNPCRERNCPKIDCMKAISVEEVFYVARKKLLKDSHSS